LRAFELIEIVKHLGFLIMVMASGCQTFREQPVFTAFQEEQPHTALDTSVFHKADLNCLRSVKAFYGSHAWSFFWADEALADSLKEMIRRAGEFGLLPEDYHLAELEHLSADTLSTDRISRMDVLLTDAYLSLYLHIETGRLDPVTLDRKDLSQMHHAEAIASLENIDNRFVKKQLREREPDAPPYRHLKEALKAFPSVFEGDQPMREMALKIMLNMERWRWQKQWPSRYVLVNIPSYSLRVIEDDSVWLASKVIVGKRDTPTPVLESVIRSFIIYPYWHVPQSISTKEILPALQANGLYLQRNNFEVLDRRGDVILPDTIQWDLYTEEYFPFVLRQREGSENSMGIIKFNFANNYGVYLHDTNSKRLFRSVKRSFSHGCVRVEQAIALAHYLVREDDIYVSPEDLDQYLSLQQRLKIDLRKPVPVKLEYFTAEVLDGVPVFYEDIYKRDSVMIQSLFHFPDTTAAGLTMLNTGEVKVP